MILEELEFARARGAKIYAEMVGYGMTADAFHITMPDETGSGAMRVMQKTLKDAGVEPEQVGYINAHGTSTPYNDKFETLAIKKTFGEHAYKLAVSSTKSMTGHLLGAAGGIEGGLLRARDPREDAAADDQLRQPRSGVRSRLRPERAARGAKSTTRSRTASASAARTPRCCSNGMRNERAVSYQLLAISQQFFDSPAARHGNVESSERNNG